MYKEKKNQSDVFSLVDLLNIVDKVWGREEWIVNNEKYCGKKLILKKGYSCSMHHHKIKDETFYILSSTPTYRSRI